MTDQEYRTLAHEKYTDYGKLEVDENAVVSRSEDSGAYVAAWVWVCDPRSELADEEFPSKNDPGDFHSLMAIPTAYKLLDTLAGLMRGIEGEEVSFVPGYRAAKELLAEINKVKNMGAK